MTHEQYVTIGTAKLLHEVGLSYNEPDPCYEERIGLCGREYYPKPTQAQALRYLREEHHILVEVSPSPTTETFNECFLWSLNIFDKNNECWYSPDHSTEPTSFELATEEGIQKACEHIIYFTKR